MYFIVYELCLNFNVKIRKLRVYKTKQTISQLLSTCMFFPISSPILPTPSQVGTVLNIPSILH